MKLHQVVDVELSDSKLINGIGGERAASRPPRRKRVRFPRQPRFA